MPGASIQQILGATNLTGLIQEVVGGVPENILPTGFTTPNRTVSGNLADYVRVKGTRQTARLVQYGGPSVRRDVSGVSQLSVTLMHTFEHISIPAATLMNLREEAGEMRQRIGQQTVARAVADFGRIFRNLRVSAIYSLLSKGAIYFDGSGHLLPTSSGAAVTVDFGVAAGHKDQLGGIIAADWDEAATDIPGQVANLLEAARQGSGYEIEYAFYGSSIMSYLLANNYTKALIQNSPSLNEGVARGAIPDGFLGIRYWRPIHQSFFVDSGGTVREWFGADQIVFTPEPSADWYEFIEGTYPVPQSLTLGADLSAVLGSMREVPGSFSYAAVTLDPPGGTQYAGDTFIPVLKVPDAIYIADVKAT